MSLVQLQQEGVVKTASGVDQKPLLGLLAVIAACMTSGFAGVYFEKILKDSKVSVWMRNVQLCIFSIPLGFICMFVSDYTTVLEHGMFFGYSSIVWLVVAIQAFGGLLVAVVVKYADNILKGFATTVSIIVSCVASVYFFAFHVTLVFSCGAFLVVVSIFLYSMPSSLPKPKLDKFSPETEDMVPVTIKN